MGQTSKVSDGLWGYRVNSGNRAANCSITSGGSAQNWRRALNVKSGQSSRDLRAATLAAPLGELALHFGARNDALRTEPPVQLGPEGWGNEVIRERQEKVVPRLIGHLGPAKCLQRGLVNGDARDRVRSRHHLQNDSNGIKEVTCLAARPVPPSIHPPRPRSHLTRNRREIGSSHPGTLNRSPEPSYG